MTDWVPGETEYLHAAVYQNGVVVSTGTVTATATIDDAGTLKYLQSDEATFSTTPYSFTLTYAAATDWVKSITVPQAADGKAMTIRYTHSVLGFLGDEDKAVGQGGGGGGSGLEIQLGG